MGYYVALAATCLMSGITGWLLNDWWRQLKEQQDEPEEEKGKWDEL